MSQLRQVMRLIEMGHLNHPCSTEVDREMAMSAVDAAVYGGQWANRPLFALDADVTVYWPDVRPCYVETAEIIETGDEA